MNFDGLWLDMNEPTTFCNGSYPICNSNSAKEKKIIQLNSKKKFKICNKNSYN